MKERSFSSKPAITVLIGNIIVLFGLALYWGNGLTDAVMATLAVGFAYTGVGIWIYRPRRKS